MVKFYILFCMGFLPSCILAQFQNDSILSKKFQFTFSSGIYADMNYANVLYFVDENDPNDGLTPPLGYPDKKGRKVNIGKSDKFELQYKLSRKHSISFYYQRAFFTSLYGTGNDPLEIFKDKYVYKKRNQYSFNYYRNFITNAKYLFQCGVGLIISDEIYDFLSYRIDPPPLDFTIRRNRWHWTDPGTSLNFNFQRNINRSLNIGINMNTYYLFGIGIEGASLHANIGLKF